MPEVIASVDIRGMVRDILKDYLPRFEAAQKEAAKKEKEKSLLEQITPGLGAAALAILIKKKKAASKELEGDNKGMDQYPIDQGALGSGNEDWDL